MIGKDGILEVKNFRDINIKDSFFDSLKEDYEEFESWFKKKSDKEAFIFESESDLLAFLYLKVESEEVTDIEPNLPKKNRLKIGTFKIEPHGTRLGERFIKKMFDYALDKGLDEAYVTIFKKHDYLIKLFEKYGFKHCGTKTTDNGIEEVYIKCFSDENNDVLIDYPVMPFKKNETNIYLMPIDPPYHTRLFPDSILNNEDSSIVDDCSHTNSIHKVYIAFRDDIGLKRGDILAVYRTKKGLDGPAKYKSVVTSFCVVEEVKEKQNFVSETDFIDYCRNYSIFTVEELEKWYKTKQRFTAIKMTYNLALKKRVIREFLLEEVGISENDRINFLKISPNQFWQIKLKGMVDDERTVIYKT
ncbi:MAG: N-acetyltransferase [Candidatus Cloacimonadota bacterium]|nr:MAG: N-acetyltransferase [Candidatus Cloacimonadota bacterium]